MRLQDIFIIMYLVINGQSTEWLWVIKPEIKLEIIS